MQVTITGSKVKVGTAGNIQSRSDIRYGISQVELSGDRGVMGAVKNLSES